MRLKAIQLNSMGVLISTIGVLASILMTSVNVVSARSIDNHCSSREDCIKALEMINSMEMEGCDDPTLTELRRDALNELQSQDIRSGRYETLKIKPAKN